MELEVYIVMNMLPRKAKTTRAVVPKPMDDAHTHAVAPANLAAASGATYADILGEVTGGIEHLCEEDALTLGAQDGVHSLTLQGTATALPEAGPDTCTRENGPRRVSVHEPRRDTKAGS